jgi:hypothetical protein
VFFFQLAGQFDEPGVIACRKNQIELFCGKDPGQIESNATRCPSDKNGFTYLAGRTGRIKSCSGVCGKDHVDDFNTNQAKRRIANIAMIWCGAQFNSGS